MFMTIVVFQSLNQTNVIFFLSHLSLACPNVIHWRRTITLCKQFHLNFMGGLIYEFDIGQHISGIVVTPPTSQIRGWFHKASLR